MPTQKDKVKIKVIITYQNKEKILETSVENDPEEYDLYAFCNKSDFTWSIKNEVAKMLGKEVPEA